MLEVPAAFCRGSRALLCAAWLGEVAAAVVMFVRTISQQPAWLAEEPRVQRGVGPASRALEARWLPRQRVPGLTSRALEERWQRGGSEGSARHCDPWRRGGFQGSMSPV